MMRSLWSISVVQLLRLILLVIRLVPPVVALTVHLPIEFGDKCLVGLELHQMVLATIQYGRFDDVAANGQQIGTGPFVLDGRATVAGLTAFGKAAAANTALEETGYAS